MNKKLKLICYGAGAGFKDFQIHLDQSCAEIIGVIDRDTPLGGVTPAFQLQQIHTIDFDYVVICSRNYRDDMIQSLLAANVAENKIIAAPNCAKLDNAYENNALMKQILKPTAVTGNLVWGHMLPYQNYDNSDYVRKATLSLIAEMMRRQKVEGALAELGVCTGAFARLISELFPEKEIYLFDTFEGFDSRDLTDPSEFDRTNYKICDLQKAVKETTVESVLANMPFKEKCIIRKGYFPETAEGIPENISFSFVSLDVDLYNPTIAGLKWFYPRMAHGGVIMVHDYGSFFDGIAKAVDEFARDWHVFPVPIPDECGSVLIVHP